MGWSGKKKLRGMVVNIFGDGVAKIFSGGVPKKVGPPNFFFT